MKKLQSLKLKNFCSYDYSEIEFGEATLFRGDNGHGKSNILLALVTVLFNLDFPEIYIRNGQKEASIEVVFDDGSSVYRERQKTKQQIILTDSTGKTQKFSSSKCTDQVREFTGFHQIQLDRNSTPEFLQYVPAKSPQFLLDKSPEVVLRMLSALIGGQGIELVKAEIQSEVRTLQTEERHLIEQVDKSTANLEYLQSPIVENIYNEAQELQKELDEIDDLEAEVVELIKLQTLLEKAFTDEEEQFVAEVIAGCHEAQAKLIGLNSLEREITELSRLHDSWLEEDDNYWNSIAILDGLEKEIEVSKKELQAYKCKQCGKLVKELCVNC